MLAERAAERGSASLLPSPSLQQPSLCISKSLHCTALQGFAPCSRTWHLELLRCSLLPSSCTLPADKPDGAAIQEPLGHHWLPAGAAPLSPPCGHPNTHTLTHSHAHTQGISKNSWHKLKPSITSQAGFPARLGQGPVFQVSATSLKEARQGRETGTGW